MNAKKYNPLLLACIALVFLNACTKKLDIAPEGVLTEQTALQEKSTAQDLVAGAYQQMFLGLNGDTYTIGDLTTGIAQEFNNSYYTGAIDPNDGTVASIWNNSYAAINLANVIITKLKKYAQFDTVSQNQFVAEARFIRAFSYFTLLELYGDGALEDKKDNMCVPLRLQSFDGYDGSQNIPRSTNDQVYAQIIDDLNNAIATLPVSYPNQPDEYSRATQSAAAALAARVMLYRHDYTQCTIYCDQALADANHVLAASPVDVFPDNSSGNTPYAFNKEVIFGFPVSYNNDPTQYAQHNIYYEYGDVYPDSTFLRSYNQSDLRLTMVDTIDNYGTPLALPVKFSDPNLRDNLVMIRLAEVVLTKAEALAFLNGVNQTSVDLLNQIHQRAFAVGNKPVLYTTSDFAQPQDLIDQILQEKKWEFAYEGRDRFEEIAAGKAPNPVLPENKYELPIPQYDIDITSGLIKQNPGYN